MRGFNLTTATVEALNQRISDEYAAHYFYRCAANWCEETNYKKAAEFFSKEADNELEHAKGIQEYLTDFGVIPTMGAINVKKDYHFDTLFEIILSSYEMELDLMNQYNNLSSILLHSDLTTFDFLTTYRVEQKEAIVEYADLLDAMELIDKEDKFQVLYFEQTYM